MLILLDTHLFLWSLTDSRRLGRAARTRMREAECVYVSSASIWEIAIKSALGKLEADPEALVEAIEESGFIELPVRARHAAAVARLPDHHRDPFDRLLVAQAMSEPLFLLTADERLARYSPLVQVV